MSEDAEAEANSGEVGLGLGAPVVVLAALQISLVQGAPADEHSASMRRQLAGTPWTLRLGPQRPDLVRYNRVEGLSLGIRGQLRPSTPVGPVSVTATARIGHADRHLNGRLDVVHQTIATRIGVSGYHELAVIEEDARHLGPANSLMALLYGQDNGDYYRRSGGAVEWTPPDARPREFRLRVFAEYQEGVAKETDVQVARLWDDDKSFRPNLLAEDRWDIGASLVIASQWGTDPTRLRQRLTASGLATVDYWRASFGFESAFPLRGRTNLTLGAETGGAGGTLPPQRLWYLGGPRTLRGYAPLSLAGTRFYRGSVSLDRAFPFGRLLVFADGGWAGGLGPGDSLASVGAGVAIVDDIVRVDVARQLESPRNYRLDVYLGQLR